MRNKKGFTLIELLVVIAIIGLLSTLAVVSLNSARAKARDARRMSDVKQVSTVFEIEEAGNPGVAIKGCIAADARAYICNGPGEIIQIENVFTDPSSNIACTDASTGVCDYSVSQVNGDAAATTSDYQVCFYLESGAGGLAAGLHAIEPGGVFGTCD